MTFNGFEDNPIASVTDFMTRFPQVLLALAQAVFGAFFAFALEWHRPGLGTPHPLMVGVVTLVVTGIVLEVARRMGGTRLFTLLATVQLLVLIGFLLRMRVVDDAPRSFGLYLVGIIGLFVAVRAVASIRRTPLLLSALGGGAAVLALMLARSSVVNGARINASVAGQEFQPAELIRVCLLGVVAYLFAVTPDVLRFRVGPFGLPDVRALLRALVPAALGVGLFAIVKDLGPAALLVVGLLVILFALTSSWFYAAAALAFAVGAIALLQTTGKFEYVQLRIDSWLLPFPEDGGLTQVGSALLAYARGGLFGDGPGLGRPESIGPESANDFILAVAAEELGLVGLLVVVGLLLAFAVQLMTLAREAWREAHDADSRMRAMWSLGLAAMLVANVALPVLAASRLTPVVGVTTPLLSAGSTSLVLLLAVTGFVAGSARVGLDAEGHLETPEPLWARAAGSWKRGLGRRRVAVRSLAAAPRPRPSFSLASKAVLVVSALVVVLFAHATVVAGPDRIQAHDPNGTIALHNRATLDRGRIVAADEQTVLVETRDDEGRLQRRYPAGDLYGEVAGYIWPRQGTGANLEYALAEWTECGPDQHSVAERLLGRRCQAADVVVTLEPTLQETAARALGSKRGAVVAIDPRTGAVLALVSSPRLDYDEMLGGGLPADMSALERANTVEASIRQARENDGTRGEQGNTVDVGPGLRGLATDITFNPGSSFKPLVASAVPEGRLAEFTAPQLQRIELSRRPGTLSNAGADQGGGRCGGDVVEGLRRSCNTFFAMLARDEVGESVLRETAAAFGFEVAGEGVTYTDVDDLRLQVSRIDTQADGTPTGECDIELMAIGQQCVHATPFQMALVAATLANDGVPTEPYLVDRVVRGDDVLFRHQPAASVPPLLSAENLALVHEGMVAVTQPGGTATTMDIPGVEVAAKTGTAQDHPGVPGVETAHAWAIAYANADGGSEPVAGDPTIAVCVFLEGDPGDTSQQGGRDAGPIARQVLTAAHGRG